MFNFGLVEEIVKLLRGVIMLRYLVDDSLLLPALAKQ